MRLGVGRRGEILSRMRGEGLGLLSYFERSERVEEFIKY